MINKLNKKHFFPIMLLCFVFIVSIGSISAAELDNSSNTDIGFADDVSLNTPVNDYGMGDGISESNDLSDLKLKDNNLDLANSNSDLDDNGVSSNANDLVSDDVSKYSSEIISDDVSSYGATPGTFDQLQDLIDNAVGGSITLDRDYQLDDGDGSSSLSIRSSIVINGNGHTILGLAPLGTEAASIFYVRSNAIALTLNNLNLDFAVNSMIRLATQSNLIVNNCNLTRGSSYNNGGAISGRDGYATITVNNSNFIDCHSPNEGGAIYNLVGNVVVINSTFINNIATGSGGAIATEGDMMTSPEVKVTQSTFINNQAGAIGGAISTSHLDTNYSIYLNNSANSTGGSAIHYDSADGSFSQESNYWGSNNPDFNDLTGTTVNSYVVLNISGSNSTKIGEKESYSATLNKLNDGTPVKELLPALNVSATATGGVIDPTEAVINPELALAYTASATGKQNITINYGDIVLSTKEVDVLFYDTFIDTNNTNIVIGDNLSVSILSNDTIDENPVVVNKGKLDLSIAGTFNQTVNVVNGTAVLDLSNWAVGSYNLDLSYIDNDTFKNVTKNINIIISKMNTTLSGPISIDSKPGKDLNISVSVVDEKDNVVNLSSIIVILPDSTEINVTVNNGTVSIVLPENVTSGNVTLVYPGDSKYLATNITVPLTIGKLNTEITTNNVSNVSSKPGQNLTIPINVTDENGNSVIVANVTVVLSDGTEINATVNNGTVSIVLPENVTSGNVTLVYPGDSKYLATNITVPLTIGKLNTEITTNNVSNVSSKPGQNLTIPINVTDENGNSVIVANVTVVLPDGSNMTVAVVNGSATIELPEDIVSGNLTIDFTADDKYNASDIVIPLNITKWATNITANSTSSKPGQNTSISISVVDENSKPVVSGNVTVTLPNGQNITVPVVNGSANLNITVPKGTDIGLLNVSIAYNGTNYYADSSANISVEVNPLNTTVSFNVTQTDKGYYVNGAVIDENGDFVNNGTVTLVVGNNTYNVSVSNGTFNFTIPALSPGNYNVTVSFNSDNNYLNSSFTLIDGIVVKSNDTNSTDGGNGLNHNGDGVNSNLGNLNTSNSYSSYSGSNAYAVNSNYLANDMDMKNTGNPLLMLLMALFVIGFGSLKRKF